MSEHKTPGQDEKAELEFQKLQGEVKKLDAEVPKLIADNHWLNRYTAAVVSVAAVLLTGLSLYNTWTTQDDQQQRSNREATESTERQRLADLAQQQHAQREQLRLDGERSIRCVELGMKVAEFTREQTRALGEQDRTEVELRANTVIRLFPPAEAAAILRAMAVNLPERIVGEANARNALQAVIDELERGAPAGCHRNRELRFVVPPPRGEEPMSLLPAALLPPPVAPAACPALPAAPRDLQSLLVFSQIVQDADRDTARRILDRAKTLDAALNRAPIEDVRAREPAAQRAEVRYYRRDHEDEATRLVAVIKQAACLEGQGARLEGLRAVFIGDRFQNLPPGRIELWFPQLVPRPG